MTSTKYTRQDYSNKVCSHSEYYGQFVTKGIKSLVLRTIGEDKLMESKKDSFNDIPLAIWDGLAIQRSLFVIDKAYSPAGAICILKEAAKQIVEEKKNELKQNKKIDFNDIDLQDGGWDDHKGCGF